MARRLVPVVVMLAVGVALLTAAVAGTASDRNVAAEARKGGTLRLATFQEPDSVDTALAYTGFSWPIGFATCAKLFSHPDVPGVAGARVIPEVVRSYTVSRDGRTYTFELKRTFRFHTGSPVTAQSFADAFERDANPRLASPARSFMREIAGAQAVIDGKATSITGIRVLDRYRLQIRLTKPLGDFIARLTLPFFCPVLPNTPVTEIDDPAGSGPYYVAERIVNQRIVLRRNPFYRGSRPANVDRVVWTIGETRENCLAAVEEDRIHHCVSFSIPNTAYRPLAETYGINRPDGRLFVGPTLTTWFLVFNHDRPAFKGSGQIPLKKAINFAIDRPALVRPAGYLAGKRTDQLLPPALAHPEGIYPLGAPNLVAARRWHAQARLAPRTLVLYATNSPFGVIQAQVLDFNLKQLGIDLEVKYFDVQVQVEKISTRGEPFDLAITGWAADYADGGNFFALLDGNGIRATNNLNWFYFDDPETNARIAAANRLRGEARRKAWADLDVELMRDNPPMAPLFTGNYRAFVSESFGCFLHHAFYGLDIAAACLK